MQNAQSVPTEQFLSVRFSVAHPVDGQRYSHVISGTATFGGNSVGFVQPCELALPYGGGMDVGSLAATAGSNRWVP